jgi:hypothetical protein
MQRFSTNSNRHPGAGFLNSLTLKDVFPELGANASIVVKSNFYLCSASQHALRQYQVLLLIANSKAQPFTPWGMVTWISTGTAARKFWPMAD